MGNGKIIALENLSVFKTLIETKMSENLGKTDKTAFLISANSWNALAESMGGLNYSAEILDNTITASDNVDIWFNIDSRQTIVTAGIDAYGETADGKIILYAEDAPAGSVSGVYYVKKG